MPHLNIVHIVNIYMYVFLLVSFRFCSFVRSIRSFPLQVNRLGVVYLYSITIFFYTLCRMHVWPSNSCALSLASSVWHSNYSNIKMLSAMHAYCIYICYELGIFCICFGCYFFLSLNNQKQNTYSARTRARATDLVCCTVQCVHTLKGDMGIKH